MPQQPPVLPQAQDAQPNSAKRSAANLWCWPMGLWWLAIILEVSPIGLPLRNRDTLRKTARAAPPACWSAVGQCNAALTSIPMGRVSIGNYTHCCIRRRPLLHRCVGQQAFQVGEGDFHGVLGPTWWLYRTPPLDCLAASLCMDGEAVVLENRGHTHLAVGGFLWDADLT